MLHASSTITLSKKMLNSSNFGFILTNFAGGSVALCLIGDSGNMTGDTGGSGDMSRTLQSIVDKSAELKLMVFENVVESSISPELCVLSTAREAFPSPSVLKS